MLELGISQAQMQFTKILDKFTIIVDKKSKKKKAVIIPYEEYEKLIKNNISKKSKKFSDFVGVLDEGFKTEDIKYQQIVK